MPLTWLHLSDLHLKGGGSYDRDVVLRALVTSVRRLRAEALRPHLIFATGDIAFSGKPAEYKVATRFFDDLLAATELERRHLFVIPGNHDVDRSRAPGLARSLTSREDSDAYFAPRAARPHLTNRQAAFRAWYNDFFRGVRTSSPSSCGPPELVEAAGTRVGVLPINSALFAQGNDDHAKLWIGRRALNQALTHLTSLDADLRIALMHHPPDWLADQERSNIRASLAGSVDVILRGHLHETDVEQVVSDHRSTVYIAAGAAYQTREWPNRAVYTTFDGASLEVRPVRYEDSPIESWTIDPSVFPHSRNHTGHFGLIRWLPGGLPPASLGAHRPAAAIPVARRTSLLGRNSELQWLDALWREASEGRRQIALLRAREGLGKTRLAAEWAEGAQRTGRVLYGDAGERGSYQPFGAALSRHLLPIPVDALGWIIGQHGGQISRIVRQLPDGVRSPLPEEGERGPERARLFEATRSVVARLCESTPTALIIDNARSIDEDGLALLQTLLTLDDARLFVLLLSRPYGRTGFATALPQMRRNHLIHERDLHPLDDEHARQYVLELTGKEPARGIIRDAQGIPIRLETLAARPRARRPRRSDPEHAIVAGLPPADRLVVELAALGPSEVPEPLLAQTSGLTVDQTCASLRRLASVGLLAPEPPGEGDVQHRAWRFTHAVRRQAVIDAMDHARSVDLAGRLAAVLVREPAADPAVLADLCERAGLSDDARRHALRAAEAALGALAYDKAASHYRTALEHMPSDAGTQRERCRIHNCIGHSLWHAGRFRDSRASYATAATLAMEGNHTLELVQAALGRAGRTGFEGPSGDSELVATLRATLQVLGPDHAHLRVRVLAAAAHAMTFSGVGSLDEAKEFVREAQALARSQNDLRVRAEVLCTTSWAMWAPDNLEQRLSTAEEAVELADQLGDEVLQIESRLFRITCRFEAGDIGPVRDDVGQIEHFASIDRSPYYLSVAAMAQAALALLDGPEAGDEVVSRALTISQREHNPALARIFGVQVFYTRLLQGRLEELRTCSESLVAYDSSLIAWRSGLALLYAELSRFEDARREFEQVTEHGVSGVPINMFWFITLDNLARVCLALGDRDRAAQLSALLRPYADRFIVVAGAGAVYGPVALNLGLLTEMCGHSDEALRLVQRAHQLAHAAGCLPAGAEAAVEAAHLMLARPASANLDAIVNQLRRATREVETVGSRRLALRVTEAINLTIPLADGQEDTVALAALQSLVRRGEAAAHMEEPPSGRVLRVSMARASRAGIKRIARAWSDEELERRLGAKSAERAVLRAMVHFFQPDVAYPFRGTLVLRLAMSDLDAEPLVWALKVGRTSAERIARAPNDPDLLVSMRATDFMRLLTGELNGVQGWFEGGIDVQGDPIVAGRLVEMFGGPAPVHALAGEA